MAEDLPSPTVEAGSAIVPSVAKERPKAESQEAPPQPGITEGPQETSTKGMLREAIQKVMREIEHHEQEAKKHLQQAKALRNDLRDSFAFLQEREEEEKPIGLPGESRSSKVAEQETGEKARDVASADKHQRINPKKKHSARKAREG